MCNNLAAISGDCLAEKNTSSEPYQKKSDQVNDL